MLRHIVLVSFKPEASEAQLAAWRAAVTNLCETSEEVLSFTLGSNVGSGPNTTTQPGRRSGQSWWDAAPCRRSHC